MGDILGFIGTIPDAVWDILPAFGVSGWVGTAIKAVEGLLGLTAVTRIIPDKWLYVPITQFFDKAGMVCAAPIFLLFKAISEGGRKVLGKRWEKIEEQVFEKAILLFFRAVFDGISLFIQRIRNSAIDGLNVDDPGVGNL